MGDLSAVQRQDKVSRDMLANERQSIVLLIGRGAESGNSSGSSVQTKWVSFCLSFPLWAMRFQFLSSHVPPSIVLRISVSSGWKQLTHLHRRPTELKEFRRYKKNNRSVARMATLIVIRTGNEA